MRDTAITKDKADYNPFISFYGRCHISPVRQDLSDFKRFLRRREKLFTTLGVPPLIFSRRRILEIGPGGGYNSLAFFRWGGCVDFVEPNPKAREELPELLERYGVKKEAWDLYDCKIESFYIEKKYDVILAEGFMHGLNNKKEVLTKIKSLAGKGGIVIVTCVDDISCFFEILKRLIGAKLIYLKGITEFHEKVDILVRVFRSHFQSLRHVSRLVEDYVIDNFLNPSLYIENLFSMGECIEEFDDTFILLGSSPAMFTDYSWYKDLEYDAMTSALEQFYMKRHTLMLYNLEESLRAPEENKYLAQKTFEFRQLAGELENYFSDNGIHKEAILTSLRKVVEILDEINLLTRDIHHDISDAICEAIDLLIDEDLNETKISSAQKFTRAFGRGQQYMCFMKKLDS